MSYERSPYTKISTVKFVSIYEVSNTLHDHRESFSDVEVCSHVQSPIEFHIERFAIAFLQLRQFVELQENKTLYLLKWFIHLNISYFTRLVFVWTLKLIDEEIIFRGVRSESSWRFTASKITRTELFGDHLTDSKWFAEEKWFDVMFRCFRFVWV